MSRLTSKVAIVSGGARGMGASHARAIVAEGGSVLIGDILDQEGSALATELGEQALYHHLDVTNEGDWAAAVAAAEAKFGPVNVLVNNAGIADFGPIVDYPLDRFRKVIEINCIGQLLGIQAVVPSMRKAGSGSIINISSIAGLKGYPQLSAYVTSKFGSRGLTKAAAIELGEFKIRANSVHPGTIRTPMTEGLDAGNLGLVALHREGEPQEITNIVVFLASDESSFCTGAEFVGDGGETTGSAAPLVTT